MENEKISKLAMKLSLPMIISMISMAIYNIVDTIFVSKISTNALTAVSLAFPIQIIISAIGLGIGIGINSFLAKAIGAKEHKKEKNIIFNAVILGIISYLIIIFFFNKHVISNFFRYFNQNEEIVNLGMEYINIIILFSAGNIFQNIFNKILEAYGKARQSMISQFCGMLINTVLDPILIFGINGFLQLGVEGAAIATIIGRMTSVIISISVIVLSKDVILPRVNEANFNINIIKNICKVGIPTIILESVAPIITMILNDILISFTLDAVSFYGIYYKVQGFIFMIISGLNYGMIPIIAYNIGAKKGERVIETIKWFLKAAFIVTFIGTIIFAVFPHKVLGIFEINENTMQIGIRRT